MSSSRRRSRPGLPFNPDFNGAVQLGCGLFQVTQKNGERWSAASAYLHPGGGAEKPHHRHQGAGDPRPDREGPRRRRRICARRQVAHSARRAGSGARRRRHQLAAAVAALRRRSGRGAARDSACRWRSTFPASARTCRIISTSTSCSAPRAGITLDSKSRGLGSDRAWRCNSSVPGTGPGTSNVAEAGAFVVSALGAATPDIQYHFIPAQVVDHARRRSGRRRRHAACLLPAAAKPRRNPPGLAPIRCSRR